MAGLLSTFIMVLMTFVQCQSLKPDGWKTEERSTKARRKRANKKRGLMTMTAFTEVTRYRLYMYSESACVP